MDNLKIVKPGNTNSNKIHPNVLTRNENKKKKNPLSTLDSTMYAKSEKKKRKCVIYPESKFIQFWDVLIFILIIYCIIVNPIEIAFIDENQFFYVVNLIIDFTFMVDIVLNFLRAFENKENKIIDNPCHIATNYICGWIWLDIICAFPYTLVLNRENNVGRIVRISRLTKISKMVRLLRFLRSIKFFNQTEKLPLWLKKLLHQDSFIKGIFRTSIFTLLMVHIVACLWKFAAEFDPENTKSNWLLNDVNKNLNDLEIYIACVYWAIQTVFTVGYGDFTPITVFQLIISILAMLFGVFLFGTIISSISNIFESMHNHSVETISLLDNLYKFRQTYKIDDNLYHKCIEYILNRKSDVEEDYKILFKSLPAEVRKAMNKEIYKKKLKNIAYFSNKSDEFLGEIGPKLENISFSPHDQILNKGDDAEEIYFLKSGVVAVLDQNLENVLKEYHAGSVFGEWDIFFNSGIRKFFVTAKEACNLDFIVKKDFDEIYFQKFTNESNQLMISSKENYNEMLENELKFLDPLNKLNSEVMTDSEEEDEQFKLESIMKSTWMGKLAGTLKETKEFKEVVYLKNLNNQIDALQSKVDLLTQRLNRKGNI